MRTTRLMVLVGVALLCSCGTAMREFEIRAVNTRGESVPCIVVIDDRWPLADEEPLRSPATVKIEGDRDKFQVLVKPLNPNKPDELPTRDSPAPYRIATVEVKTDEPRRQLLIVEEDPEFDR